MAEKISRRQVWMKLAVLIADGLPEPRSIGFNHLSDGLMSVTLDSEAAFMAWVRALGAERDRDIDSHDGTEWLHEAAVAWHGWRLRLGATSPRDPEPEEITEDLTKVRDLAAGTCVCCSPGDCGDRRGHVEVEGRDGWRCNCGRAWPCDG